MFAVILLCVFLQQTHAVIYKLNESDFARMPPVIHLDPYESCALDVDALYCTADFALVSDEPSPLLDMIKAYSEDYVKHYNRTQLNYGICVTQTCKQFYDKGNLDLKWILEECLNKTLSEKYELKVKIIDEIYCEHPGRRELNIDTIDGIVGVVCLIFLLVNLVGTICDIYFNNIHANRAFMIFLCFSIKRNWKKLISSDADEDSHLQLLKGLHGVRTLTMCLVIVAHAVLAVVITAKNPEFIEELYRLQPMHILMNGTYIMHTFLILSSFLLVYKWLLYSKDKISWYMLPKHVIMRWIRLTPAYAFILALTATWFRHFASGPLRGKFVLKEMQACRDYWWKHILYVNNYLYNSACMTQTWYLAVDMQLYIVAVIVYLACRSARSRKIVLSLFFVLGMILPAAHVYFQDLDATQLIYPESIVTLFGSDTYFNTVYKRSHTNLTGYAVGMAMAYAVYYWQKQGVDFKKYKTFVYRFLYRCLFPLAALCCYSGYIFYADAPRLSVYIRTAHAALVKPAFTLFIGGTILGCIFQFEDFYRSILEWRGWTIPSRLSYSAYLLHVVIIRSYGASSTETIQYGYFSILTLCFDMLLRSFTSALFFWLLVEAPLNNVLKECLAKPRKEDEKNGYSTKKAKQLKSK